MQLEDKQRGLSEKLQQFVDENDRIRQQLYHRDRQAELKTRINKDVIKTSDIRVRESLSRSPVRQNRNQQHSPQRSSSPLRHPHPIK